MTMTLDHHDNRHLGSMGFDHMPYGNGPPHFTNPFAPTGSHLFGQGLASNSVPFDALPKRAPSASLQYGSAPAPSPSLNNQYQGHTFPQTDIMTMSQELVNHSRSTYEQPTTSMGSYVPTSAPYVPSYTNIAHNPQHEEPRRPSHSSSISSASRAPPTFTDALDASRGMVALSQDLTTPRGNVYGSGSDRSSSDSYGFPPPHSAHSSVSSASYTPASSYYAGSVDGSMSDYGSQSDMESVTSRTLPRPTGLIGHNGLPPQSMMGQFNSKVSSSTQKKHKCKVCDKRFTRPSSLQTHMYSHTGEKPYACEHEGCGRHFSVVSNLRRHRKVHKTDRSSTSDSDHPSPEGSWSPEK